MTITQQQIAAAQQDADAFNMVPGFNRINFIEKLLAEDVNTLFNARMVRYLLDSLKEANVRGNEYKEERRKLLIQAKEASLPVTKGKVAVKLARIVAKQADALASIDRLVDSFASEVEMQQWQLDFSEVIEAAR